MQKRTYGRHNVRLSVVGFGGILVTDESVRESSRRVSLAIDRGVNYFDVAPSYGNAEQMLGPALEPYRRNVFLACKTTMRDAAAAETEFRASLRKLRTDHIDLYQIHAIQTDEEVEQVLARNGALSLFEKLRRSGAIRYIGFSAHNEEAALRLLSAFAFDSVLFPINWLAWHAGGIGSRLMDAADECGTAVLALKALAQQRWAPGEEHTWHKTWYRPAGNYQEAERALRFTLSRPVVAAVSPGHIEHFRWACDAADRFTPLSAAEERGIAELAQSATAEPVFTRSVTTI
ncbi:MAG: aldo/keto reductase [Spirochaetaceae bacterium]|nr:MAG: aldo/keto reductase [Spirochaetaceae bacterium]